MNTALRKWILLGVFAALSFSSPSALAQSDLSVVPLWDGETQDPSGRILNRFGGNQVDGIHATVSHTTAVVRTGTGAFRVDTNQVIPRGGFDFVGIALTGFGPSSQYVDTRDLSLFGEVAFWLRNETGEPLLTLTRIRGNLAHQVDSAGAQVPQVVRVGGI